jgi:hypothetical protein
LNRELIATTLFDRLQNSPDLLDLGFVTFSRDQLNPTQIQQWNALCLLGGNEIWPGETGRDARQSNRPAMVTIEFLLWIYAKAGPSQLRETLMNNIQDALDKALAPERGYRQSLGLQGVQHCRIEGSVLRAPVQNSDQIYAHAPILVQVIEGVETAVVA